MPTPLTGLAAATYTPFDAADSLNLADAEPHAPHLLANSFFDWIAR